MQVWDSISGWIQVGLLAATPVAGAASDAADTAAGPSAELGTVVVVGTRTPQALIEQTATISVLEGEDLARQQALDLRDALRYEPGVSVRDQGSRFGLAGVNIRGIEGNRVNLQVDGVRLPQAYAIGDFSNAARDFFSLDAISQIEVLRGPASSLYGSDALGGVVRFNTLDPRDWLQDADHRFGTQLGYSGVDDSLRRGARLATGQGEWSMLVSLQRRDGQSRDTQGQTLGTGATRTARDPSDTQAWTGMAKLVHGSDPAGRVTRLVLEELRNEADTAVLSQVGQQDFSSQFGFPYFIDTGYLDADDQRERRRASVEQSMPLGIGLADRLRWQVSLQHAETDQRTTQSRTVITRGVAAATRIRERRFLMEERIGGLQLELDKRWGAHRLIYGVDLNDSDISGVRDGSELNTATGVVTTVVGPDAFPVRDFPRTDTQELALFLQDEWRIGSALTLIGGLRWDRYDLDPRPDATFIEDNPGITPVSLQTDRVSPKLGLRYALSGGWMLTGQWAAGFRSPPFSDVNVGFTNFQFGYTALPNPDLRPERSRGFEAGVRWQGQGGSQFALTAFHNRYTDFIESLAAVGVDPESGLLLFQSRNVDQVRIHGAEARLDLNLGQLATAWSDFRLRAALAWAEGENRLDNSPLSSVDPLRGTLGLLWQRQRYGLELVTRFGARADAVRTAVDGSPAFEAPGFVVLDAYAHLDLWQGTRLELGVGNLLDRTWYEAANVRGLSAASPALLRFSEPGRHLMVQWRQQF